METEQEKQEVQEIENAILDSIIEIRSDPVIKDETENFPWTMYVSKNDNRNVYSLYLYDEIYDPQYYSKLFEIIRKLQENDALDIHLNSPGGSLTTLVAFVNVLQESDATVTMYIDGFAESAAAILAFTGDELVIREHSSIMFHNIHTGGIILQDSGKIKANIESMHRVYKHMLETFCSSVLTNRQINNIIKKGSEVYYSGAELLKKLS